MRPRFFVFFFAVAFASTFTSALLAATKTWIGPANGDFHDGANWTPVGVPGITDVGQIGAGASVIWSNATSVQGAVEIASGAILNLAGAATKVFGGRITNEGTINVIGTGSVTATANSGAAIYNASGGLFDIQSNFEFFTGVGTTGFHNAGTLRKSAGTGTPAPFFRFALTNSGTVEVLVGTLQLVQGDLGGTFHVASGASLIFAGTYIVAASPATSGAGSVTLSGSIHFTAPITNYTLSGGTLFGTNSVTGTLNWSGGTIDDKLTIVSGGALNIMGSATKNLSGMVTNEGTINVIGTGGVTPNSGAAIYNTSGGLFDIQSNFEFFTGVGTTGFHNAGTLRKSAGTGTPAPFFRFALTNSGTVEVLVGTLQLVQGDLGGTFHVASGASLIFAGTYIVAAPPATSGAGTVTLSGSIHFTAPITDFTLSSGTLFGTNRVTGTLNWSGGTIDDKLTVAPGAVLNVLSNVTKVLSAVVTNEGTINVLGTGILSPTPSSGAAIYNTAGGLFDIQTNFTFSSVGGVAGFNNAGTLRKSAGTGITSFNFALTNSGTVEVQVGTLQMGTSDLGGTFTVASGATLILGATYDVAATPVTSGAGTVTLSGSIHFTAPISNYTLSSGTLFGTNAVSGTLNWAGGTIGASSGTSKLTILPGGTLNLTGSVFKILSGPITNQGTINVVGTGNIQMNGPVAGTLLGGLIFNEPGGLFDYKTNANTFSGGSLPFFQNAGTLRQSAGTGPTTISVPLTNSGTMEVQIGMLSLQSSSVQTSGETVLNGGLMTVSQPFQLQGGTLGGTNTLTGSVNNTGGTVAPGLSPGRLNISGNYTQAVGGSMNIELAGTAAETGFDRFVVSGTTALNGTLNAILTNGFYPATNASFAYLTAGSVVGTFSSFAFPSTSVGMEVRYTATTSTLVVTNVLPFATNTSVGLARGSAVNIPASRLLLLTSDPDLHSLDVAGASTPLHGNASVAGGFLTYTPANTYSGPDSFAYIVSDPGGLTATGTVSVTVYEATTGPNVLSVTGGGGTATVRIAGVPGAIYRLQYTTDLTTPTWQDVAGSDAAVNSTGVVTLTDPSATDPQRFYRTLYISGP